MNARLTMGLLVVLGTTLAGCQSSGSSKAVPVTTAATPQSEYVIGPGDTLQIFVWQHPEVSVTIPVRPDGRVSTPLVEDVVAVGKTPTQLARDLEGQIGQFIRTPSVSVIVTNFVGTFSNQVRVVGQAASPQAIPFRQDMTLLDVMIQVGGLSETAAGNRAKIIRRSEGQETEIPVRIDDLINDGDTSQNVVMQPGDVLIIPESWL
ncbi:MAG: XrtA/PEP-CTERM system exopolysaccharide export protein [Gammaproteobacteria bacterium]